MRSRFLRSDATAFGQLGAVNRRLARVAASGEPVSPSTHYPPQERAAQARVIGEYFAWQAGRGPAPQGTVQNSLIDLVVTLRALHAQCEALTLQAAWVPAMRRFAEAVVAELAERAVNDIVADLRSARCYAGAPDEVREWIAFFEAAGLRRDADVLRHGAALARRARANGEKVPELVAQELLAAQNADAARTAFRRFLGAFGDAHLSIRVPASNSNQTAPGSNATRNAVPVCTRLGYGEEPSPPGIAFRLRDEFAPIASADARYFPIGIINSPKRRVGIIRIGVFDPFEFRELCESAIAALKIDADGPCNRNCAKRIELVASDLLTAALARQARALQNAQIDALVVDTANAIWH